MTEPLQNWSITVKVSASEKASFSDTQNPRQFVNTMTVDDKHYLLNRDNWTQPIKIQLSQKQKTFSEFLFALSKSISNFKHSPKMYDPHGWCIPGNPGPQKYG